MILQRKQRPGDDLGIGQALLSHQGCAYAGDHGDEVVVGEILWIHQRDARAAVIQGEEVDVGEVRIAATAGAEDPGAGRQRFELVALDLPHHRWTSADTERFVPLKG